MLSIYRVGIYATTYSALQKLRRSYLLDNLIISLFKHVLSRLTQSPMVGPAEWEAEREATELLLSIN